MREAVASERRELAGLLQGLSPAQWDAPSLCAGWRIREVVAHMTMPFRYALLQVAGGVIKDRGNFHRMSDRYARRDAARSRHQSSSPASPTMPSACGSLRAVVSRAP